jgi:hypothetical protein
LHSADPADWPLLKETRAYVEVLEPGDVLYMPQYHWHWLRTIDFNVSVNYFWYDAMCPPVDRVIAPLYELGMTLRRWPPAFRAHVTARVRHFLEEEVPQVGSSALLRGGVRRLPSIAALRALDKRTEGWSPELVGLLRLVAQGHPRAEVDALLALRHPGPAPEDLIVAALVELSETGVLGVKISGQLGELVLRHVLRGLDADAAVDRLVADFPDQGLEDKRDSLSKIHALYAGQPVIAGLREGAAVGGRIS